MRDLSDEPYKDLEADGWWWPDSLPDEETLEDGQELLTTVHDVALYVMAFFS